MARPRKKRKYRPIVVDERRYRWSHQIWRDCLVVLRETESSARGQRLIVQLVWEPSSEVNLPLPDDVIEAIDRADGKEEANPRFVAAIIRLALEVGWSPDSAGPDFTIHLFGNRFGVIEAEADMLTESLGTDTTSQLLADWIHQVNEFEVMTRDARRAYKRSCQGYVDRDDYEAYDDERLGCQNAVEILQSLTFTDDTPCQTVTEQAVKSLRENGRRHYKDEQQLSVGILWAISVVEGNPERHYNAWHPSREQSPETSSKTCVPKEETREFENRRELDTIIERRLPLDPEIDPAWEFRTRMFSAELIQLITDRKYEEAISLLDRVAEMDPDAEANSGLWCCKGRLFGLMARHESELKCYDKALEIDERDPEPWFGRGISLLLQGRREQAVESFYQAAHLGHAEARRVLAEMAPQ